MMNRIFMMIAVVAVIVSGCGKPKEEEKKEVVVNATPTVNNNEMPALVISQTDSAKVSLQTLTGRVVILFFNPDCDHCQREAALISQNPDVFNGWQVYFLSPDKMRPIANFANDFKLKEQNYHFAHVDGNEVYRVVGPINTVPTFMIYDNQKLVARMEGEISLPKLRQMLK
jgi:thiol-disulfide isomerase/thioredoxin